MRAYLLSLYSRYDVIICAAKKGSVPSNSPHTHISPKVVTKRPGSDITKPINLVRGHQAEWSKTVDSRSSMILTFSESTNRPDLGNAAAINNAVVINDGNTQMQSGTGSWSPDGRVLTVVDMDPDTWEVVTASISDGTFHAAPRKKLLLGAEFSTGGHEHEDGESPSGKLRGNLTMRMSSPGRFGLRLHVGDTVQSRSDDDIVVQLCPEQVTVSDGSTISAAPRRSGGTVLPRPFFAVEGALAMPGVNWLKVRPLSTSLTRTIALQRARRNLFAQSTRGSRYERASFR